MKTILIIGDSWGVPNYYGPPGDVPEIHTEFLLKKLGYKVYNCSLNGSGNMNTMCLAEQYLAGIPCVLEPVKSSAPVTIDVINPKIDWVLWFHTELLRDLSFMKPYIDPHDNYIDKMISDTAKYVYKEIAQFIKKLNCNFAVTGGQAPIVNTLYEYVQPDFIIEDWRSVILNEKMPDAHVTSSIVNLEVSYDTIDFKLAYMKKVEYILDKMRNSVDFPDLCHPGKRPHEELVITLDKIFKG
jgi:hypothetical protein